MIVPDMLGYGETDMPHDSSAYSPKNICNDISALLDFLAIPKAVRLFDLPDQFSRYAEFDKCRW